MPEKPPPDPVEQCGYTWHDRTEHYGTIRTDDLGTPIDKNGATDFDHHSRQRAFDPDGRSGGNITSGVYLNSGVLDPDLRKGGKGGRCRPKARRRDCTDAGQPSSPDLDRPPRSRIMAESENPPTGPMDMTEDVHEHAAFACCSAGIGRWFWVAWANESDARALAPVLASGFERSADAAARKAVESVGPGMKHLPGKWASRYRRRGGLAARTGEDAATEGRPRSRLSRPVGTPGKEPGQTRLTFLYSASESDRPGEVAVARHRIVRQDPRKIHVEREPFREEEWTSREEGGPDAPKPRTLAVDRDTLRRERRAPHRGSFFYASEEDGIRDVHAALTSKHGWCATLGVKFPCSVGSVKAAYRRLARTAHPDAGGDPAEFRAAEQAYRDALAYFAHIEEWH